MKVEKMDEFIALSRKIEKAISKELHIEGFSAKTDYVTGKHSYSRTKLGSSTERNFLVDIKVLKKMYREVEHEFKINSIHANINLLENYSKLLVEELTDIVNKLIIYGFMDRGGNFIEDTKINFEKGYLVNEGRLLFYNIISPDALRNPLSHMTINQISFAFCIAISGYSKSILSLYKKIEEKLPAEKTELQEQEPIQLLTFKNLSTRFVFLYEIGIIQFLREKYPDLPNNKMASIISGIFGSIDKSETIAKHLTYIGNKSKQDPINERSTNAVKSELAKIGLNLKNLPEIED